MLKKQGFILCPVIILFLLFLPGSSHAAGQVDADFLRVEPSARSAGMSGAFCAVSDDLDAIIYNPAGLSRIKHTTISLTHFASFADNNTEYVSAGLPAWKGAVGLSALYDYTYDFNYFDEFGDNKGKVPNYDIVLTGSYGFNITPDISLGGTAKGFISRLYLYSKGGAAFDAGALIHLGKNPDTSAGITVQNLGSQSAYINIVDPLPANIKAGLSTKFGINGFGKVLVDIDVNRLISKDELPTLNAGVEAVIYDVLALRAGYGFRYDMANVALGIGVLLEKVRFSYSYTPYDSLGTAHRLTLDIDIF